MALTKRDLIKTIHKENGISKRQSFDIVEVMLDQIKSSLQNGEDVLISGFGKFCVWEKNERKGRNPATAQQMILPARKVVTFKCSGKLREKLNGS